MIRLTPLYLLLLFFLAKADKSLFSSTRALFELSAYQYSSSQTALVSENFVLLSMNCVSCIFSSFFKLNS